MCKNSNFYGKIKIGIKRAENMKFHKFVKKNVKNPIFAEKLRILLREQEM